jgi:glycosyltransferase involved in cell wall biosynthesis
MQNNKIILSILLPTYGYSFGVEKTLEALTPIPKGVEVLIFDDTDTIEIENIVNKYLNCNKIKYQHNKRKFGGSLGACLNWNELIANANGVYINIIHHDEVPLDPFYLDRTLDILNSKNAPDILISDIYLVDKKLEIFKKHLPHWIRKPLIKHFPEFLLKRNVIGPTAALITRKSLSPLFSNKFEWLIDVKYYYELLSSKGIDIQFSRLRIGSIKRNNGTITNSLSSDLTSINRLERQELLKCFPNQKMFIDQDKFSFFNITEKILWYAFRTCHYVVSTALYRIKK